MPMRNHREGQDDATSIFHQDTGMVTRVAFREQADTPASLPLAGDRRMSVVLCTSAKYESGDPSQCPVDGAVLPAFPAWQEGWAERTPGEGRWDECSVKPFFCGLCCLPWDLKDGACSLKCELRSEEEQSRVKRRRVFLLDMQPVPKIPESAGQTSCAKIRALCCFCDILLGWHTGNTFPQHLLTNMDTS